MNNQLLSYALFLYGSFLILCGIGAVMLIGMKAKTALLSGSMSGGLLLITAWLVSVNYSAAPFIGIFLALAFFVVFSWRSAKTLFAMFGLLRSGQDLNGKGIAFLIISLMAVVSLIVLGLQLILLLIAYNQPV